MLHPQSKRKSLKPSRGMCSFFSKINFHIFEVAFDGLIVIRKMHSRDNIMLHSAHITFRYTAG